MKLISLILYPHALKDNNIKNETKEFTKLQNIFKYVTVLSLFHID